MLFVVKGRLEVFNYTTLVWGGGGLGVSGLRFKGQGIDLSTMQKEAILSKCPTLLPFVIAEAIHLYLFLIK